MPPETWYLVLQRGSTIEGAYERIGVGVWNGRNEKRKIVHLYGTILLSTV
jgi:hypothetical protein